jgi:predicted GNAT superfamily acetyltransferase
MAEPTIQSVAGQGELAQAAFLALNDAHARETSFLTTDRWHAMIDDAFAATCIGDGAALLIAFDQDAPYENTNFAWLRGRLRRFVYADRIIVATRVQGAGLARLIYEDLFQHARDAGHDIVGCENNSEPPNPGSDAFHDRMGFAKQGRATLADRRQVVRYMAKKLA